MERENSKNFAETAHSIEPLRRILYIFSATSATYAASTERSAPFMDHLIDYVEKNHYRYLSELFEFLRIPSISGDPNRRDDVLKAAHWLAAHLGGIGMENVQVFPTTGNPMVYADWLHAAGKPTLLVYGHYDVQPVDPLELWTTPPFEPSVRDENLYARGSSDDKGQLFIHLKGVEAYLKNGRGLPVNVKFIFEGEEEIGSVHLEGFVREKKDLLKANFVLISDSAMFAYDFPSICYGLRGLSYMQVEVTGPNKDLHSGTFGGAVHNPLQALAEIIASLHDKNGKVTVKGFYDDVIPLTRKERDSFKRLPRKDSAFAKELGVKQLWGEKGYTTLERLWGRPTLEVNGMWGGFTGEGAKTVLPSKAFAKISMRLVPGQDPDKVAKLFEKHVKAIVPKSVTVSVEKLHGGKPALTPIDSDAVKAAYEALRKAWWKKPVYMREGGSIPIVVEFQQTLKAPTVLLGFGLPDENAHAPDEHLNLKNFFKGIETSVYFFDELASMTWKG